MNPKRNTMPVPPDFREFALANSVKAAMTRYRVGRPTYVRWANELGIMSMISNRAARNINPPKPKVMPEGFEQHVHLSIRKLKVIYPGLSRDKIALFRKQLGVTTSDHSDRGTPPPADFAQVARTKYASQAARHYGVSESVVRRWAQITGARFQTWSWGGSAPQAMRSTADASIAGLAAQHLRRSGYSNVFKAEILPEPERKALPNKGKGIYIVAGKGALPISEMIALAEASGFDARSWARI